MARMQSPERGAKITFRVPEEEKEAYKEAVDSMSADLRKYVREQAGADDGPDDLPTDETLREAYLTLRENAGDNCRLTTDAAEALLSQKLSRPKTAVRSGVLKPLENRGFVKARWGVLTVRGETDG